MFRHGFDDRKWRPEQDLDKGKKAATGSLEDWLRDGHGILHMSYRGHIWGGGRATNRDICRVELWIYAEYWPLNFNASGHAIAEPKLAHYDLFTLMGVLTQFRKDEATVCLLTFRCISGLNFSRCQ